MPFNTLIVFRILNIPMKFDEITIFFRSVCSLVAVICMLHYLSCALTGFSKHEKQTKDGPTVPDEASIYVWHLSLNMNIISELQSDGLFFSFAALP